MEDITKILFRMIEYFESDVRRISHSLKVYGYAKVIAGVEELSQKEQQLAEIAAVLHDVGIKQAELKYNSSAGKYQEMEGPSAASAILADIEDKQLVNRVCHIIGNHHSYSKIDGIDFQILVEADFIVNIDEDKIDSKSAKSIRSKYFKTKTGCMIFDNLFM